MASSSTSVDTVALLFQAPWCEPCKKIKPYYESTVKPMYILNGISCYEMNYTSNDTKELMEEYKILAADIKDIELFKRIKIIESEMQAIIKHFDDQMIF
jgi:thiol-disulfide isomerase/thioredoxin